MWRRACSDTRSYFGWNKKTIIPSIVVWGLGAIIYWQWQGWDAVKEEIAVVIAFIVAPILLYLLVVFVFNLIRAPVFIKWERDKEPCLTIFKEPDEGGSLDHGHYRGLTIKNEGTQEAEGCRGQLEDIINIETNERQIFPINRNLQWSRYSAMEPTEVLPIAGRGFAVLDVALVTDMRLKGSPSRRQFQIVFAGGPDAREAQEIPVGGTYLALISVTSKDKEPIYALCYLDTRGEARNFRMEIKYIGIQRPNLDDYRLSILDKKDYQI
jgi:hypothetical protein